MNRWLRKKKFGDALVYGFCRHLIEAHIEYLKKFSGKKCLISDIDFMATDEDGEVVAEESAIYEVKLPDPIETWIWDIAPAPEIEKNLNFQHKVGVFDL